jgi:uncharacterized protein YciI
MFVISLTYTAPLDAIDAHLPAHRAWLAGCYADGKFLASGPKVPREGGIIIAHAGSRDEVDALVRQDPFHAAGVASYEITEFLPAMTAPALAGFRAQ